MNGGFSDANVIYHHLSTNLLIQWSWGFHSPKAIVNGLKFHVRGLAFQGEITIRFDHANKNFVIVFYTVSGGYVRKVTNVRLDELINVLDRNIDGVHGDWWQEFKKQYVLNSVSPITKVKEPPRNGHSYYRQSE